MTKLGLQMYSIKEAAEKDLLGTLEKVANMGYHGAQFAGFFNHSAKEVKNKMDQLGLQAAGAHVPIEELQTDLDGLLTYHETIGNRLLICPYLPENMRTTADDYKRTAEIFNRVGEKVAQSGFRFGYHNHAFEFESFDGKTGFDLLYENTDPQYVKMELDCFWAEHANNSPIDLIGKYADRIVSLHIKDLKMEQNQPISTEIGNGTIDNATLIDAGYKYKVDWLVVEQEDFTKDPLDSAIQNAKTMQSMLANR